MLYQTDILCHVYFIRMIYTIKILVVQIYDILYDFYGKHRFSDMTKEMY